VPHPNELRSIFTDVPKILPPLERSVIEGHYFDGVSIRAVGDVI
jgi:hypothetical protein